MNLINKFRHFLQNLSFTETSLRHFRETFVRSPSPVCEIITILHYVSRRSYTKEYTDFDRAVLSCVRYAPVNLIFNLVVRGES